MGNNILLLYGEVLDENKLPLKNIFYLKIIYPLKKYFLFEKQNSYNKFSSFIHFYLILWRYVCSQIRNR